MIAGIFLGGASSRMGSPKALLTVDDGETLFARTVRVVREAGLEPCLVGPRPEILADLGEHGLVCLADAEPREPSRGPLGGLVALLRHAEGHSSYVIALACDMPYLDASTLRGLVAACARGAAHAVVAPRRGSVWEPLCAAYEVARVLPVAEPRLAAGALGLQGLLDACDAESFAVSEHVLHDWDTVADVHAARARV